MSYLLIYGRPAFWTNDNGGESDIRLAHSELNKYKYSSFTPGWTIISTSEDLDISTNRLSLPWLIGAMEKKESVQKKRDFNQRSTRCL